MSVGVQECFLNDVFGFACIMRERAGYRGEEGGMLVDHRVPDPLAIRPKPLGRANGSCVKQVRLALLRGVSRYTMCPSL